MTALAKWSHRDKPTLSSPCWMSWATWGGEEAAEKQHGWFGHALTSDDGRHSPADGVVEAHGPEVDVASFGLHAVDVEALDEEPGEGREEEAVQKDGNHSAEKLGIQKRLRDGPTVPTLMASSTPHPHPPTGELV